MTFYTDQQRQMQKRFDSENLAAAVEQAVVSPTIEEPHRMFIESRDMFFLSTVDAQGRPTVSYKGGPRGVVMVLGPQRIAFPAYDGNGMFLSLGNVVDTANVGLLFIDFETPNRLRLQGRASLDNDLDKSRWPGAIAVVSVEVESCFMNCARYVHTYARTSSSPYVPSANGEQPHPSWKRIDKIQAALSDDDRARTSASGGTLSEEQYFERLIAGVS